MPIRKTRVAPEPGTAVKAREALTLPVRLVEQIRLLMAIGRFDEQLHHAGGVVGQRCAENKPLVLWEAIDLLQYPASSVMPFHQNDRRFTILVRRSPFVSKPNIQKKIRAA